jgi:hypothetical protein
MTKYKRPRDGKLYLFTNKRPNGEGIRMATQGAFLLGMRECINGRQGYGAICPQDNPYYVGWPEHSAWLRGLLLANRHASSLKRNRY